MVKIFLVMILVFSIYACFIFNIECVNAIGVASPYSGSELALELSPGEEKEVYLKLSNFDIEEGISMQGKILEGNGIASLDESVFSVPYQSIEVYAKMIVKISKDIGVGERYSVVYEFKQVGGEGGGMVSFSQGIVRSFDVIVVEEGELAEEPVEGKGIILWVLGILLVIIIIGVLIWFVIKSRKRDLNNLN